MECKHRERVDSSFRPLLRKDTHEKTPGDLPMGMTTPNTATVRFSPRRKFSFPAEERDEARERN